MKKLLIILFVAVMISSCKEDYRTDLKPISVKGVELKIDSSQWKPALVQIEGNSIQVYEANEIRKIFLWDIVGTIMVVFFMGLIFGMIIVAVNQ